MEGHVTKKVSSHTVIRNPLKKSVTLKREDTVSRPCKISPSFAIEMKGVSNPSPIHRGSHLRAPLNQMHPHLSAYNNLLLWPSTLTTAWRSLGCLAEVYFWIIMIHNYHPHKCTSSKIFKWWICFCSPCVHLD